jgi:carboxypeptidase C (cathepsin A)
MRKLSFHLVALLALLMAAPPAIVAQERSPQTQERSAQERTTQERSDRPARSDRAARAVAEGDGVLRLLPANSDTDKEIDIGGRKLAYTATAGTMPLYDQNGERSAAMFYTAYVRKGADTARRPVTFVFNGGPGAASAFLHLGLAGPRIVDFGPEGRDGAAARLVDNPDTWLAFTDLVMIDPVGTGWSRPAKSDGGNAFWNVRRDAESIAKFIALYVAHNSRLTSPKYLLGESYGGFRAAKVARALQGDQGIIVSGIVMVSPLIETSFLWGGQQFALGAALNFPSLVASELERTKTFTPQAMAEAERFALTDYLTTLAGPPPTGEKATAFYDRVAQMTGLPPDVVAKSRGFVRSAYVRHQRAQGSQVSSYDGGFSIPDPFPESDQRASDPMLEGFPRALSGAFASYARDELGFKTDMTYALLNGDISGRWDWGGRREQPGISDDLRILLAFDPSFRVMVVHGRSDLVTPYAVSRYLLEQLPQIGGPGRTQFKAYRGGHMFYFDAAQRRAFAEDARAFYRDNGE